jgi:hypothetical protein
MQESMNRRIGSPLCKLELYPCKIPRVKGLSTANDIIIMFGVVIILISSSSTL